MALLTPLEPRSCQKGVAFYEIHPQPPNPFSSSPAAFAVRPVFCHGIAAHGRLSALYLRVQVPTLLFAAGCILLLGMAQRAPQGTTLWSRFLSALHRFSSGHRAAFASLCCLFVGLLRWVLSGVFSWWTLADALAGAALVSLLLWFQCSGESC